MAPRVTPRTRRTAAAPPARRTVSPGMLLAGAVVAAGGLMIAARIAAARATDPAALRDHVGYPPLDVPKRVADGVWVVDSGPLRAMGLAEPVRMTILRLGSGELVIHSPTPLGAEVGRELAGLGRVRHLIAPNSVHWLHVKAWQRAYPEATTWAAPGLRERWQVRREKVRLDHDLGETAPAAWAADIGQGVIAGGAGFREVYLFHRASRTLILTDLIENLDPAKLPPVSRAVMQSAGATTGTSAVHLRAVLNMRRAEAAEAVRAMLDLKPERVIFAHGAWFEERGVERLERAFAWLV